MIRKKPEEAARQAEIAKMRAEVCRRLNEKRREYLATPKGQREQALRLKRRRAKEAARQREARRAKRRAAEAQVRAENEERLKKWRVSKSRG